MHSLDVDHKTRTNLDPSANAKKITVYLSIVRQWLYIGRLISPPIAFHASQAATKCSGLESHHLRRLNDTLKRIRNQSATIVYQSSHPGAFQLEAMSDAVLNVLNEKNDVREGILMLCRSNDIVYAIG